ncbi:MAG: restriction endonuclease subunit S [Desulfosporosinus sp.]
MNANIDLALNMFYQRQISTREQLLNEMLRIKMVIKNIEEDTNINKDKEKLFQFMKKITEDELGFFPADRDDFFDLFQVLKKVDLIDFTLEIYKNDRLGKVISPLYLNRYISEKIRKLQPQKILITEAEKHLSGLRELIKQSPDSELTLTTQLKPMNLLLRLAFGENPKVTIHFESIYTDCLQDAKFDYIYSLPTFSYKPDELGRTFITRDSDGVAIENMLGHLNEPGTLDIIVPAKITFAGQEYEKLRLYITDNYSVKSIYILPEGTFRPVTAIKTYFFTITTSPQNNIEIGTMNLNHSIFQVIDKKIISTREFLAHEDWRIELLLSEDDENIQRFKSSHLEKVKLKEVAEVFRGKSILKKDTTPGSISVLNISNIENSEINYSDMAAIEEDERKIKRYELLSGDVVLSCRGTAIKTAVFEAQNRIVIASANLIVIRPKEKVIGEYIKTFLESPMGIAIIKSFQRGTIIMNINHADILEMEIPLIPIGEQKEMIANYKNELSIYKRTICEAESRWTKIKDNLYNQLI